MQAVFWCVSAIASCSPAEEVQYEREEQRCRESRQRRATWSAAAGRATSWQESKFTAITDQRTESAGINKIYRLNMY